MSKNVFALLGDDDDGDDMHSSDSSEESDEQLKQPAKVCGFSVCAF